MTREIGEIIAKPVLGEVRMARILNINDEGEKWESYYTDGGCYWYKRDLAKTVTEAEEEARKWKGERVQPHDLQKRKTWTYIRSLDKRRMWMQIGIYNGMLYWKDACTYEFLEPAKNLKKAYDEQLKRILFNCQGCDIRETEEHPMERLYKFKTNDGREGYATAEFVKCNERYKNEI